MHLSARSLLLACSLSVCFASPSFAEQEARFPITEDWLTHASSGLAPYWMQTQALGVPIGNFPTFRCDDGSLLDVNNVCPELNHSWITPHFDREYTRMKSRQTYAYGVLFHLTGDTKALALAKQGAYYLIEHLRDTEHGGFVSFTKQGNPGLKWTQRTSQDQAYALVGLAMYYYLTRDPVVENALIEQQRFIFEHYKIDDKVGLAWVLQDGDEQSAKQHELVAQLDQINGYLLLVAPLLPEPHKAQWLADLNWLTKVLVEHYHSESEQRFYGAIHHKAVMQPDAKHNDFGHTIKAYWMTYLTAKLLNNQDWQSFAEQGMKITLKRAKYEVPFAQVSPFFSSTLQTQWQGGTIPGWQSRPNKNRSSSWEWAELDQAAMTLAMNTGVAGNILPYTTRTFMDVWVDHQYGGVGLNPKTTKAFHWGNGYHQFEHALVGTIASGSLNKTPVTLYYAIKDANQPTLTPYYFQGQINDVNKTETGVIESVTYSHITP